MVTTLHLPPPLPPFVPPSLLPVSDPVVLPCSDFPQILYLSKYCGHLQTLHTTKLNHIGSLANEDSGHIDHSKNKAISAELSELNLKVQLYK